MAAPLEGVRVLDMSHVIAGPLASLYLAQFGAEVIKIESPQAGDVLRAMKPGSNKGYVPSDFTVLNAGKKSFAVDIRTTEGAELLKSLAAQADVVIENFRPGVVKRRGLEYESISKINPSVVYCSISGYGQEGEWAQRGAYDHVIQALTGMMMMSGDANTDGPVKVGFPVVDVAVGMLGALAITTALHQRARDGKGQYIDASMVQASLMLMYTNASAFLTQRVEPERIGNRGQSRSPTADTYRCLDGWLALAANTPAQFRKLTALLGLGELCDDATALDLEAFNAPSGGFVVARNLEYLRSRFHAAFASRSAREMELELNAQGIPAARVRRLGEFLDEVKDGSRLTFPAASYPHEGGVARTPGLGFKFRNAPEVLNTGAPSIGQDTIALMQGIGISDAQIRALQEAGIIKTQHQGDR